MKGKTLHKVRSYQDWRKYHHSIKMAWKVFAFLVGFVAILLVLLWVFQTVMLQSFYTSIKTRSIMNNASIIAQNIDNPELKTLLDRIASSDGICIRIVNESGEDLCSAEITRNCTIHNMKTRDLVNCYQKTVKKGGSLESFGKKDNQEIPSHMQFNGKMPPPDRYPQMNLVYSKIATRSDGVNLMILLNAQITPVNATVETLRIQLIYITLIMLVLALFMAILISHFLARPIIKINESAKQVATGNYDIIFDGKGYQEITELNATLNHMVGEVSKSESLRRELIANISHDLRTPLTMISGYAEVIRDIPGENTPENVQIIIDEANRLSTLVSDLMDISKLQSGVQTINASVFSLTDCTHNILTRYAKLVEQDGYQIKLEITSDAYVNADDVKIGQVIYNLVNNAINYTGANKEIIIRQFIQTRETPTHESFDVVRVEISDTGEGIAKEQLPLIWDRYYKVDKRHKQARVGTGLGLSIVKSVLELHHAAYGVESEEGVGSTFWFELPICDGNELEESNPTALPPN